MLAVKVVDSLDEAIEHIDAHSTHHSDAILTENYSHAMRFVDEVDSAAVYVNASTRFTDGGQFGLGAEVAISTQRLHARGPMGAARADHLQVGRLWGWASEGVVPQGSVGRYRHHLYALLGYLALTLVMTYPLIRELGRAIPGDGFDGWQNVWNLWWVKRALLV